MRFHIWLILTMLLLTACVNKRAEMLMHNAESVMDEQPDSSLIWMKSIDGSKLSGEQRARHALLLSKAQYKCYIEETNDSVIKIATDYYSRHNHGRLIQALFYQAQIQFYAGNVAQSLTTATMAEQSDGFADDPEFAG